MSSATVLSPSRYSSRSNSQLSQAHFTFARSDATHVFPFRVTSLDTMSATEQKIVRECPTHRDFLSGWEKSRRQAPEVNGLEVYRRLAARFRKQCSKKKISLKGCQRAAHNEWQLFVQSILLNTREDDQHQAWAPDASGGPTSAIGTPSSRCSSPTQPTQPRPNRPPLSIVLPSSTLFSAADAHQNKDEKTAGGEEMVHMTRHRQERGTKMNPDEGDDHVDLSLAPDGEEEDIFDVADLNDTATKGQVREVLRKIERLMVLMHSMQPPTYRDKDDGINSKRTTPNTTSSTSTPSPPAQLATLPATTVDPSSTLASLLRLPIPHTSAPLSCMYDSADYSSNRATSPTQMMMVSSCNERVHRTPPQLSPVSHSLRSNATAGTTQASRKTTRVESSSTSSSRRQPPNKKQRCDDLTDSLKAVKADFTDVFLYNRADAAIDNSPSAPRLSASSTHSSTMLPVGKTSTDDNQLQLSCASLAKLLASIKWTIDWRALRRSSGEYEMDAEEISTILLRCSWLSTQQKKEVRSLLTDDPSTASQETLASALVAIHTPLLPDSADDDAALQRLMNVLDVLLPLSWRHGKAYADSIRQEHIAAIANTMSYCSHDSDVLRDFLEYVNLLTSFRHCHTNIIDWVETAWPIETTLCFMQHHHTEREVVIESLQLLGVHAEHMRRKSGQELVEKYEFHNDVFNTVYKQYKEDGEITQLLGDIVQPLQRWSNSCRSVCHSTPIFRNTTHVLLEVLDASSLDTRRRVEDDLRSRINGGNKHYFSHFVRVCLISEVLTICGKAGYCRDTTHHAIDIVDLHFSNATDPIDINSDACRRLLVACILLAVRLESNVSDRDSPLVVNLLLRSQVEIALNVAEKLGWRVFLERCLTLPSKPMFWLLQILYRVLAIVQTDGERAMWLLHAKLVGRAGQLIDIMMLYASELPYRLMAAVAFHIVYKSFIDNVSKTSLTEVTGYSLTDIEAVTKIIVGGSGNVSPYHLKVNTKRGGEYIDDAMAQPKYDPNTHLHAYVAAPIPKGPWYTEQHGEPAEHPEVWLRKEMKKGAKRALLGQGTYGRVEEVIRADTNETYALKVAKIKSINSTALREIDTLRYAKRFRLQNVCPLAHVDATFNKPKDVRIWLPLYHETLAKKLSQKTLLAPAQIRSLLKQLLTGVCELHSAGIIHRDLKPQNILLRPASGDDKAHGEQLVIADFGLSRVLSRLNHNLTGDVATLHYLAVEVLFDHLNYTFALDMWSVGCVFAEMITGRPLFRGKDSDELKVNICRNLGVPPLQDQAAAAALHDQLHVDTDPQAFLHELCMTLPVEERENAVDLLRRLLEVDYTKRIRAKDALLHAYFSQ